MNWKALQYNKCPKCNSDLDFEGDTIFCQCGFKIGEISMRRIVEDEVKKPFEYDKSPARVLCDVCGREFDGQAWMLNSKKKVKCRDCFRDTKAYL